jgi:Bifunctional DNA primase/polymerase, N-terminal
MTQAQSPGNGMGRGDAEINSAAEFSLASLMNRTHNAMLEAAWALAAAAWEVFPCKWAGPHAKAPMTVNGHLNATMDPDQIKLWWTKWPNAMIGAAVPESLLVIDIDPRNGGSLEALEEVTSPLPATLTVWSGRNDGGRHLYFQRPANSLSSTRLPKGVDLKGNGYCIMPPSIHPATGQPYRWQDEDAPAVAIPAKLSQLLRPPATKPIPRSGSNASAVGLLRTVVGASEGSRNNTLFWAACRAAEQGILNDQVEALLINAAVTAGENETKARRTVASARRKMS